MPSLVTHYLFGQDILSRIESDSAELINSYKGAFCLGLQGPDIFLYDLLHTNIAKDRNFGRIMHIIKTDSFFQSYIESLMDSSLSDNKAAVSYLYGMLCHYSLDCSTHPYIYYQTNLHDTTPAGEKKSILAHREFETHIDELLYHDRFGKSVCNVKRNKFIECSSEELAVLSGFLADAISNTYQCTITASYIRGTVKRCDMLNSVLTDRFGFRRKHFAGISGIEMVYDRKLPSRECLNENNNIWLVPVDGEPFQSSFMDLYNHGLANASRLIDLAHSVLFDDAELEKFVTATGGKSYDTGKSWHLKDKMVHFKSED